MEDHYLLLQSIYEKYGYDFRDYSPSSLKRRIAQRMRHEKIDDLKTFRVLVENNESVFARLVADLSINVTSMFRDPFVWRYLREKIFSQLATYPRIRIWSAGTASGEEAYSIAIILKEMGLYDRSLIYATDFNSLCLEKATQGNFPLKKINEYTSQYNDAGGTKSFSNYYITGAQSGILDQSLMENIVFSTHNLTNDGVFNEFQMIFCRNVLIYFQKKLTDHVLKLFFESLGDRCYLCLGTKESLLSYESKKYFKPIFSQGRVFRRVI